MVKELVHVNAVSPVVPMRVVVLECLPVLSDGGLHGQARTISWMSVPLVTGTRKAPIGVLVVPPVYWGQRRGDPLSLQWRDDIQYRQWRWLG